MSSAKKQQREEQAKKDTQLEVVAEASVDATGDGGDENSSEMSMDEAEADERRHHPDSKSRDRRVIARLGHPEMRTYFSHISKLCRIWVGFSAAYIVAMMIGNYSVGKLAIGRSLFYDVVVVVIAIAVHRFDSSVRSYLRSESQAKLVIVAERLFLFLFISVILGSVMGAVHLITLF